jgi:hypothetical protein
MNAVDSLCFSQHSSCVPNYTLSYFLDIVLYFEHLIVLTADPGGGAI